MVTSNKRSREQAREPAVGALSTSLRTTEKESVTSFLLSLTGSCTMPVYIRKGPLEIPPGSEKDWTSEEQEEDYFLRDPAQSRDCLPQPYRMLAKVVELVIDQVMEVISIRQQSREAEKLKEKINVLHPTADIHVSKRVNCMTIGESYLFVGLSEGMAVYGLTDRDWICGWEAQKVEVCSLSVCRVQNHVYFLSTVDDMGIARLFYFSDENLSYLKAFNEPEDVSKRTNCLIFQLSQRGDYAGILLEGAGDRCLEVYKLPKEIWLKELESSQATLPQPNTSSSDVQSATMPVVTDPKITQPALLMKIRPPKPLTGSIFKSVQEAVQKSEDGSVFGTGQNHLISSHQWEQQDSIFMGMFEKHLRLDVPGKQDERMSRNTMFHFLQHNKVMHSDSEQMNAAVLGAIIVHWDKCQNHLMYLLGKQTKDKTDGDLKPDVVWPCAAPIKFSAVSSCSTYFAFGLEDETLTVWDMKRSGFPIGVVVLPEGKSIASLYFVEHITSSGEPPAAPRAQVVVWCTDKSLYLVTAAGGKESSLVLLHDSGIIKLLDVAERKPVCQFELHLPYKVAFPWQPVYVLDAMNHCLFLKANEETVSGEILPNENSTCSLFAFSLESVVKTQQPAALTSQSLHWEERCKSLFEMRLQTFSERRKQIAESWSLLRRQASDFTRSNTLSM
ncbi:WD repeat-containing protein 93 isoform X2 [Eleutherodactylus coqui]|uniref:WD repeat-containing protein 93 isoform X2 n=1 Tax=Eleutherodactylus coqui TaxID=57060 RepID=UPI0034619A9F